MTGSLVSGVSCIIWVQVFKLLIDEYTQGRDTTLRSHIEDFISAEQVLQGVPNPSGGVGEPKFNVNVLHPSGWFRPFIVRLSD